MKSDVLKNLLDASVSPASKRALESDLRVFEQWAGSENPLPANEMQVSEFIADQSDKKATSTIIRYVSSLSRLHDIAGMENPTKTVLVRQTLSGLRKTKGIAGKQAPALSGAKLLEIFSSFHSSEWSEQRNKCLLAIGWAGALRCSELHALNLSDIDFQDPLGNSPSPDVIITIRRSKTDQDGRGTKIGIPSSPISSIIHHWVSMAISLYLSESGPLFPSFSRSTADRYFPKPGARNRLSIRGISKIIRTTLQNAGISGSVHSLRRGVITEAARVGVPERVIQRHSRHASTRILRSYCEDGNIFVDNPLPLVFESLFGREQFGREQN
jgi:integrase